MIWLLLLLLALLLPLLLPTTHASIYSIDAVIHTCAAAAAAAVTAVADAGAATFVVVLADLCQANTHAQTRARI